MCISPLPGSIGCVQTLAVRLGQVIRQHRDAAGLTQEMLAERADLHWTYVSLVERGRRNVTVEALSRLAAGLGVPGSSLLREAEDDK